MPTMNPTQRREHWNAVYTAKADDEVSWYEPEPRTSLDLIQSVLPPGGSVLDVGGGTSRLVDHLLALDVGPIAVLDISPLALERAQARLGDQAGRVRWIAADVTQAPDLGQFDVWHDRAVFHFLTDADDRRSYADLAARTVRIGGHAILGTFALDGPPKCSGLDVCRYDAPSLARELGPSFRLMRDLPCLHVTPAGKPQSFCFAVLRRVPVVSDSLP
jgi:SAM-dependent methyltransferase